MNRDSILRPRTILAGLLLVIAVVSLPATGAKAGDYTAGALVLKHIPPKPNKATTLSAAKASAEQNIEKHYGTGASPQSTDISAESGVPLSLKGIHLVHGKGSKSDSTVPPRFRSDEPTVYLRFEYEGARRGDTITAVWNHIAKKPGTGAGVFGIADFYPDKVASRGQFSFSPKGGGWYPGEYRVDLYTGQDLFEQVPFRIISLPGQAANVRGSFRILDAVLAKGIKNKRPKDPVREYSDMWKRLLLWVRVDGGRQGGKLTARWLRGKKRGAEQARFSQKIRPGENWVVFWLNLEQSEKLLPVGSARVELRVDGKPLKTVHYKIRESGLLDSIGDALEQAGHEFKWLMEHPEDQ